jgi:limonene-1,2-epoxide hydrolase
MDPTDTVTAFLAMWTRPGGFAQSIRDHFAPEAVYENVGMSRTVGAEGAIAWLAESGADPATFAMRADTLAIAAEGNRVLTERVDHLLGPDGQSVGVFPVMGSFEVVDGKIVAWRDYFDTAGHRDSH